jgi:hypothetical protein
MEISIEIGVANWRPTGTGGVGSPYDPASDAIFAAFTTPPTTARKSTIDTCVLALKAAGVWTKLDALYMFAAADSQAGLINWKAPGTYDATLVNAPAFTADQGFTGAATKYLDSGFNPFSAPSPKFVQDSACAFAHANTNVDVDGGIIGTFNGSIIIFPRLSGSFYLRVNNGVNNLTAASTDSTGFWSVNRSAASAQEAYKNGASVNTNTGASAAFVSQAVKFLYAQNKYWTGQVSAGGIGQHLSAAEQTALYNALNTYLVGVGAVSSYQAETNAIAAAFTTPPTTARKNLIDAAVVSLKSAGVWTKLDALYAFAAADSQAAKINWKAPGTFNATEVNAPAFVADLGFTGASTKYLDSGYNPTTAPSAKYTLNNAGLFAWSLTATGIDADIAGGDVTAAISFRPRSTGNQTFLRLNQGSTNVTVASADATGFWTIDRSASNLTTAYKNGASIGTDATVATTLASNNMTFLKGGGSFWTGQVAAGGFGQTLNSTEQAALYNALNVYIASVRIFSAFTTPPTAARQTLIQTCVASLMTAGVWDKLDALHMFAAADSQAAKINWKNPGTFNATEVNAPTFAADQGFTGNGTTSYLDTGFNPTISGIPGGGNYGQNSACGFGYEVVNVGVSGAMIGNTSGSIQITGRGGTDLALGRVNNTATSISPASIDSVGLWSVTRSGAAAQELFKNAVSVGSNTGASLALTNGNIWVFRGITVYRASQCACVGIGGHLNSTEQTALYNAIRTYLTGVGVP